MKKSLVFKIQSDSLGFIQGSSELASTELSDAADRWLQDAEDL